MMLRLGAQTQTQTPGSGLKPYLHLLQCGKEEGMGTSVLLSY